MTRTPSLGTALGAAAAIGLAVAGCGPGHLARAPEAPVDLSGHWLLAPEASDDAGKLIAGILPKPRPRPPQDSPAMTAALPPEGGRGGGSPGGHRASSGESQQVVVQETPPAWGHVRPSDFVNAFALPPRLLEVEQQSGRVRIGADAHRREFEPGDEAPFSVTDRFGSRTVRAGWQHDEFVITSSDGSRLNVVEHYRRHPNDELERTVEFHAQGLKSITVRSVYRRATPAEVESAAAAGPPEPERR